MQESQTQTDYKSLIAEVRRVIAHDKRAALTDPHVKAWCARRWRDLFLTAAIQDPNALETASHDTLRHVDERPLRQRVAERFLRNVNEEEWRIRMPEAQHAPLKNCTLVFAPGLLNGLLPVRAFQHAFPEVEGELGIPIIRADSHPLRGCQANMADIDRAIHDGLGLAADTTVMEEPAPVKEQIILFGYSKGGPDALTYLVSHPEMKERVRAVFNICGANGGSHIADDMYKMVRHLPTESAQEPLLSVVEKFYPVMNMPKPYNRAHEMDIKEALHDLTTDARDEFNQKHYDILDSLDIPIFDITGATSVLEVPYFQAQGEAELNLYDVHNDMQLTQHQAKVHVPMATHLAMLHGHHWDVAYPSFPPIFRLGSMNLGHPFPKKALVTSIVQLAAELGLVD